MIETWEDLKYWNSGEWQVVEERLDDLEREGIPYCPDRENLFASLYETPFKDCRVAIFGQDPYPNKKYATGLAFSIPKKEKVYPPTLKTLFQEYGSDLHYPSPLSGDLTDWCAEGVLLWNIIPSCLAGHSLSHDWYEWSLLTLEILDELATKGTVFCFMGSRSRRISGLVHNHTNHSNCRVVEVGHPSQLAYLNKRGVPKVPPFLGSRVFTTINDVLTELGHDPIDWKLPCRAPSQPTPTTKKNSATSNRR